MARFVFNRNGQVNSSENVPAFAPHISGVNVDAEIADLGRHLAKAPSTAIEPVELLAQTERLEKYPRETLIRMLRERGYDENFVFQTRRGGGERFVQAMRTHLSRTRHEAAKRHVDLREFKLLIIEIQTFPHFDQVTLVRTTQTSRIQKSVYDELVGLVAQEVQESIHDANLGAIASHENST